ncbi:hypothetical protein MAR_011555, partial [Mya arenaria]
MYNQAKKKYQLNKTELTKDNLTQATQDMYVTNSTCGTEFSLDPSDDIRFHYDGGKVYDPNRSIYGRCEVKITNNHKGAELCVWAPYSRYTGVKNIDWTLKCSEMFQFGFTYRLNTMSCDEFLINEKCDIAKIAYATFREPFFHDEESRLNEINYT